MRDWRKVFPVGAALVVFPAPAAAGEFCAALERIVAAAGEPVPFASLEGRGDVLPGYQRCRVETRTAARRGRILCSAQFAPSDLEHAVVGAQVEACLGLMPSPPLPYTSEARVYDLPTMSIDISSHCNDRCHVGRIASFIVRLPPLAEDRMPASTD